MKKLIIMSIVLLLIIVLLCSCSTDITNEPILCSEQIKFCRDYISGDKIQFGTKLLTTSRDISVQYMNCSGVNTEALSIDVQVTDEANGYVYSYDGWFAHGVLFSIQTNQKKEGQIDSVTLSVDGSEHTWRFDSPIIFNISGEGTQSDAVTPISLPVGIPLERLTNIENAEGVPFDFHVLRDIELRAFRLKPPFSLKDVNIWTSAQDEQWENRGSLSQIAPIKIPAGSTLRIAFHIDTELLAGFTPYDSIYTTWYLEFVDQVDGKVYTNWNDTAAFGVTSEEDAVEFIKYITTKGNGGSTK